MSQRQAHPPDGGCVPSRVERQRLAPHDHGPAPEARRGRERAATVGIGNQYGQAPAPAPRGDVGGGHMPVTGTRNSAPAAARTTLGFVNSTASG